MINTSTLRPGLLVSLKTSIRGNVHYVRRDIATDKKIKKGEAHAKWETERTIADIAEHKRAVEARSTAAQMIRSVCTHSAFGMLCPETNADVLEETLAKARKIVDAFNETSTLTRVSIYVMMGRIAQDDVEAVRAINSEVSDLLRNMENGLKNLDVKMVREAAGKAKQLGSMLSPNAEAKVKIAIDAARSSARQIAKAGEQVSFEIGKVTIRKIAEQRTAFLEIGEASEIERPKDKARAVDFTPEDKAFEDDQAKRLKAEKKLQRKIERDFTPSNPNDR